MHALRSLALIGLRGSGKTLLGRKIAEKLDYAFCDTDDFFFCEENMTIQAFVAKYGWNVFRDREEEILLQMPKSNAVISCGGGIVLREQNRLLLKRDFFTVFLDVPVSEIVKRLNHDRKSEQRPAFTGKSLAEEMQELYTNRLSLYLEVCAYRLDDWEDSEKEIAIIINEYNKKVKI